MENEINQEKKEKIIKTFFKDGKLVEFPAKYSNKMICFEHILQSIEIGKKYSEDEINEIIKTFNPDYCTIRRYLVDNVFMTRENGIYKRLK